MEYIKLHKYLAQSGICSRRSAEEEIKAGNVTVDGEVAVTGMRVCGTETILYKNKAVKPQEQKAYYMLNKPVGYVSTMDEQFDRKAIPLLITGIKERVYPVGRLDMDSEGLLLMTNDGDLTLKLTHPRYHMDKRYLVRLRGKMSKDELYALTHMSSLDDEPLKPVNAKIIGSTDTETTLEIRLTEGKNRQIRRMCNAIGKSVISLQRISIGALGLGDLPVGKYRALTAEEIRYLRTKTDDKANTSTNSRRKA